MKISLLVLLLKKSAKSDKIVKDVENNICFATWTTRSKNFSTFIINHKKGEAIADSDVELYASEEEEEDGDESSDEETVPDNSEDEPPNAVQWSNNLIALVNERHKYGGHRRRCMRNLRRLLLESPDVNREPPEQPQKGWRRKCQGLLPDGKDAENRSRLQKLSETMSTQLTMPWPEISEKFGSRVSSEVLLPFARLASVESVPIVLQDFLDELRTGIRPLDESIWQTETEVEIHLSQGTPLSPPKNNGNVIILEMTSGDESHSKDEVRLIISKNKNHLQRQLFIVFTDYLFLPQLFELGDELRLDLEIVTLEKDHCRKHEIKDKTLPVGVRPVAIYKKILPAVKQTYNLPLNGTIYNYFQTLESLLQVCIFPSDIVVDTTLDGASREVLEPPFNNQTGNSLETTTSPQQQDTGATKGLCEKFISAHGFPGIPGSNGMPGMPGIPGSQGPQGRDGEKGQTGDQGSQGTMGPKGERGIEGPRGKNGPPGMMGIKGARGLVGDQGIKGDKGEKGESLTSPSSAVPQTNWKQCVWKSEDGKDSGKIKVREKLVFATITNFAKVW
ncbi:hypothetical protein ACROYT_G043972 [Oculina patagonica]